MEEATTLAEVRLGNINMFNENGMDVCCREKEAHDHFTPLREVDQPRSKLRLQVVDRGKFQTRQVVGRLA